MDSSPETRLSLIGRLGQADNVDAWNEFAVLYQPMIFRIARRRGLQHADASEVTQEVLTRVARAVSSWDPDHSKGSFRGWLYRITRNATIDHLRKANRQPLNLDGLSGAAFQQLPDASAEESDEFWREYQRQVFTWASKRIRGEFQPNTWQAFWKTAVEGGSVGLVATELGMSTGAIYVARSRVMKRLSQEVGKRSDESMF